MMKISPKNRLFTLLTGSLFPKFNTVLVKNENTSRKTEFFLHCSQALFFKIAPFLEFLHYFGQKMTKTPLFWDFWYGVLEHFLFSLKQRLRKYSPPWPMVQKPDFIGLLSVQKIQVKYNLLKSVTKVPLFFLCFWPLKTVFLD